jgi:hypothetical protein
MQATITSVDLPIMHRCAVFDFVPADVPTAPGPDDISSLLVIYIGSATLIALIAFFARRKYKQMQAAKANVQVTSLVRSENDVQANATPSKPSLSQIGLESGSDQMQIPSSPRELVVESDVNVDVDLSDDAILSTFMQIEQSASSTNVSPAEPNRSISLSPTSGKQDQSRPVSPPVMPRTPTGRRRPKVTSPLTREIQGHKMDHQISTNTPVQEKLRAAKSLSPTDRSTSKPTLQSMPPMVRLEPSPRPSLTDPKRLSSSEGNRVSRMSLSPTLKVSAIAGALKASMPPGVSRVQRTRVLRDADDDLSPSRARIGLSDVSIEQSPVHKPEAVVSLSPSLSDRPGNENESGIFQSAAIDIDNIDSSR